MATTTTRVLRRIECEPECGFILQDHDEKELIDVTVRHARVVHGKTISANDVRAGWKAV